jgi:hypothetical protein
MANQKNTFNFLFFFADENKNPDSKWKLGRGMILN